MLEILWFFLFILIEFFKYLLALLFNFTIKQANLITLLFFLFFQTINQITIFQSFLLYFLQIHLQNLHLLLILFDLIFLKLGLLPKISNLLFQKWNFLSLGLNQYLKLVIFIHKTGHLCIYFLNLFSKLSIILTFLLQFVN